jgi:6-phosphofructokinase 1
MSDFVRASAVDFEEAYRCGVEAMRLAEKGETGYMVTINRVSNDPYTVEYGKALLKDVAVSAKPMPKEYFNSDGNYVSPEFIKYMKPLAGELPDFVRFEKIFAKK